MSNEIACTVVFKFGMQHYTIQRVATFEKIMIVNTIHFFLKYSMLSIIILSFLAKNLTPVCLNTNEDT